MLKGSLIDRLPLILAGLLLLGGTAGAQSLREPLFMSKARRAFDSIYSLDYDRANAALIELRREFPQHPAPPLYLATVIWLRELFEREELDLNRFVAPGYFKDPTQRRMPQQDRDAFFSYLEESARHCRAILEKESDHQDARYFLGAGYRIRGSFAITIDRSLREAFSHGKKAYKLHRKLVDDNPEYFDAYMSVGMYEYIVGNLPWYIKWLANIIGYRGSEKRGFEYLGTAAAKGLYVRDDARTLQMVLFIREKRPADALQNARLLFEKYPRNFLLHINLAQIQDLMGRRQQAVDTFRQVLELAGRERPNYTKLPLHEFRVKVAAKFDEMGRHQEALEELNKLAGDARAPQNQRTSAHLHMGRILHREDRHSEAAPHYRAVLEAPPYGNSHEVARRWLKKWGKKGVVKQGGG